MTLDQRGDVAVVGSCDQIALPMTRNGTIFDFSRAFADRNSVLDFAQLKTFLSGMPGASNRTWAAQAFLQFLL